MNGCEGRRFEADMSVCDPEFAVRVDAKQVNY
jgi:hypothetical protein